MHERGPLPTHSTRPPPCLSTRLRRKAPLATLDRAEWTDDQGSPVDLGLLPTEDQQGGWEVEVSPATDSEGWQ